MRYTHVCVSTLLECTWYFNIFALLCFDTCSVILQYSFSFLIDSRGSSSWRLFRFSRYLALSLRWFVVPSVAAELSAWWSCFQCSINIKSLHCTWYDVKLFHYACIISLQYPCDIIFHFSLKARDRWFDGFIVAGGTVSCQYDRLRCYWWRRDLLSSPSAMTIDSRFSG